MKQNRRSAATVGRGVLPWVVAFGLLAGAVQAHAQSGDAKVIQNHCASCHTFGAGEPHGNGPNLYGLLGRPAASAGGYAYSPGIVRALKGRVWTEELLDAWLADTQAVAPGAGMTYFQDDASTRAAIIRFFAGLR